MSPVFGSDARATRKPVPKSTEELQAEYCSQHAWTAKPVNKAALHSTGDMGVPRIIKKPCTEPKEFNLSHTNRAAPASTNADQSTQPVFKARQVSKRMLQGPQFHTLPSRKPLTETASPMLLTRTRASRKGESQQAQEPSHVFKAAPAPKRILAKPQSLPRAKVLGVTQPAEFNLASSRRHELYQQQMQQKIEAQQAAELAQAEFKAKPIQVQDKFVCKSVEERPLTECVEFNMPGQFFHEFAKETFQKKKQEIEDQAMHATTFVARRKPSFARAPTVTASTKPLTAAGSPGLATKQRCARRRAFDEKMKRKAAEEERAKAEAVTAAAIAEEEEIKRIRKQMEFKARPIMHAAPSTKRTGVNAPVPKPLTMPITPQFATAKRAMLRSLDPKE